MSGQPTAEDIKAALAILRAVADAIRDLGEVPSGELYARLMGHMNIQTYNSIIARLVGAGLVSKSGHLLRWVGPAKVSDA